MKVNRLNYLKFLSIAFCNHAVAKIRVLYRNILCCKLVIYIFPPITCTKLRTSAVMERSKLLDVILFHEHLKSLYILLVWTRLFEATYLPSILLWTMLLHQNI